MKVIFYGTRGSISVAGRQYMKFGGNTACLLVEFSTGRIAVLDAGTGIRNLGKDLVNRGYRQDENIFIALSHTHWDHIQGFPFFEPAYNPKQTLTIAIKGGGNRTRNLGDIFATQMQSEFFPVPLAKMGAKIRFWEPEASTRTTWGIRAVASEHNHPGGAYGYRFEDAGNALVYCTDVEHGVEIDQRVVTLAKNADLLIHDAQYTPEELEYKRGWGHSSWEQAVEVARRAGVKRLALFHHDPERTDSQLLNLERKVQRIFRRSFFAKDGMEVRI